MEDFVETEGKIVRTPGTFKFKVLGEKKLRTKLAVTYMQEVQIEPIDWLWDPYIPLGRLTILGGDPGAGKSFITTALASALSVGGALPGEERSLRPPMVTLFLNAEDDPADTIKPRLNNMGADQSKIAVSSLDIVLDEDGLNALEEMIELVSAKLVIIDPIVAFLGPKVDMNRANEIRHIMKALARIARRKNIAIIIVRHNRKQAANAPKGAAIYSGMGSIDFTAAVRSELAVVESPNGNKFLNHIKTNSGKKGWSIQYEIISLDDGSGMLCWRDIIDPAAKRERAALGLSRTFRDQPKVQTWIQDLLLQEPNGILANDVFQRGLMKGYSHAKLEMAKKGVARSVKRADGWYWELDMNPGEALAGADRPVLG